MANLKQITAGKGAAFVAGAIAAAVLLLFVRVFFAAFALIVAVNSEGLGAGSVFGLPDFSFIEAVGTVIAAKVLVTGINTSITTSSE